VVWSEGAISVAKQAKVSKPVDDDVVDSDDESIEGDAEDSEEGNVLSASVLVSKFIRMWPRAIFDTPLNVGGKVSIASSIKELDSSGVYILYRDDVPFYVGKAKKLRSRLRKHASGVVSLKSYFWNYFSAFVVEESHIAEVEAILISAMPSVITNSSTPTLKKVPMEAPIRRLMRELRKG
jgi:hypothetical protein